MPYFDPSFPIPLCLIPPKGIVSDDMSPSFTPTSPHSTCSLTRHTWLRSWEKIYPLSGWVGGKGGGETLRLHVQPHPITIRWYINEPARPKGVALATATASSSLSNLRWGHWEETVNNYLTSSTFFPTLTIMKLAFAPDYCDPAPHIYCCLKCFQASASVHTGTH